MSYDSMPFGKYKGTPIKRVPTSYLEWCVKNVSFKKPELKDAIEVELLNRSEVNASEPNYYHDFGPEPKFDPSDDIPF